MKKRARRLATRLAVCLVCTLGGFSGWTSARSDSELASPDWIGHFVNPDQAGEIRIKIKHDRPHPLFAEVSGLQARCDDGSTFPVHVLLKSELPRRKAFRIERYFGPAFGAPDIQAHVEVTGTLISARKAKGTFSFMQVSYDDRVPSCGTQPYLPLQWRAHAPH